MSQPEREILAQLRADRDEMLIGVRTGYDIAAQALVEAFAARKRGDEPASKRWLVRAIDAVFELAGEVPEILSDLSDIWGIDDPDDHK